MTVRNLFVSLLLRLGDSLMMVNLLFFFKQKTAYEVRISDWSSDVCSSDLTLKWCQDKLKVPAVDHWWQTETGWPIASNCLGIEELPYKPGSPTHSVPGWDVQVLAPDGTAVKPNEIGAISTRLPLPPGRSEEHTSALQSLMRISDAIFCLKKHN